MTTDDRISRLFLLFAVFLMLLHYPLLSICDREQLFWGFPMLYFYLFAAWLTLIGLIIWILRRTRS